MALCSAHYSAHFIDRGTEIQRGEDVTQPGKRRAKLGAWGSSPNSPGRPSPAMLGSGGSHSLAPALWVTACLQLLESSPRTGLGAIHRKEFAREGEHPSINIGLRRLCVPADDLGKSSRSWFPTWSDRRSAHWPSPHPHAACPFFCLKNQLSNVLNKTFIHLMQDTNKYFNVIGRMRRIVKSYGSFTSDWPRLNKPRFDAL